MKEADIMSRETFSGALQLVSFKLGDEEYAVDILKVREIIRMQAVTRVPHAPDFIEGVINLRGKVIPVMDLRKRFGLKSAEHTRGSRIVVLQLDRTLGVVVDAVSQVLRLAAENVEPTPPIVSTISAEYLKGVGKVEDRLIILLDVDKIISLEEGKSLIDIDKASA